MARRMVAWVLRAKKKPRDIFLATATHAHHDHTEGLKVLQELTGCRVALHKQARRLGARRDPEHHLLGRLRERISAFLAIRANDTREPRWAFDVTDWLADGNRLPGGWQVLYTPGHSPDSICLHHARGKVLLAGDTLVSCDGELQLNPFRADEEVMDLNINRLESLRVEMVYPGHGRPRFGQQRFRRALHRQARSAVQRRLRAFFVSAS